jgi:hypothetical protein
MLETRREMAERHVRRGREIVLRQQQLLAQGRARGRPTETEELLLEAFERSLAIFEQDLNAVRKDDRPPSPRA